MILPKQHLEAIALGENPMILTDDGSIQKEQIQICSFDCRLGNKAYAMRSAALPQGEAISDLIEDYQRYSFDLSADKTNVLERGVCYLIPLKEKLALSEEFRAVFSPKSSTGRTDVFVRVVSDRFPHYDCTDFGYHGPLFLEVVPLSFNIRIKAGLELTQARITSKDTVSLSNEEVAQLHAQYGILRDKEGVAVSNGDVRLIDGGLYYDIDLDQEVVGFEAIFSSIEELDLTQKEFHEPKDFWRPIQRPKNGQLVLTPGNFYLLATAQRTIIPPEVCGEILPYETSTGEVRPHYAGFFDNGFGGEKGTVGVLEVRCRDTPFRLVHGQPICRMAYYRTSEVPSELYDGHYVEPGPSLSKHFKRRYEVWR